MRHRKLVNNLIQNPRRVKDRVDDVRKTQIERKINNGIDVKKWDQGSCSNHKLPNITVTILSCRRISQFLKLTFS